MSEVGRFAEFMKNLRIDSKLSIEDAATKIGVGKRDVEDWETGKLLPSELSAERISQVYNVSKQEWLDVLKTEIKKWRH